MTNLTGDTLATIALVLLAAPVWTWLLLDLAREIRTRRNNRTEK